MAPPPQAGRRRFSSEVRRSDALVLRRYPYGESSLLVHVLTREHGLVHLLAKGAYRPKSAYCGVLDLFDTLRLEWRARRDSELGLLQRGALTRRRAGTARHLGRYRVALTVLDLAGLGARAEHGEHELFTLVEEVLDALGATSTQGSAASIEPELLGTVFELRFLALQGLEPALSQCASCGDELSRTRRSAHARVPFSVALGGGLCERCAAQVGGELESLPPGVLRVARSLLETPVDQLARIQLDSERSQRLRFFVRRFLEYHLDVRPRSFGPAPAGRRPRSRRRHASDAR